MKRLIIAAAFLMALASPAGVAAHSPSWNLTGAYTIVFTCTTGCSESEIYTHSMTITSSNDTTGAVVGTGFVADTPSADWTATGTVSGSDVTLDIEWTVSSGFQDLNPLLLTGTIDVSGHMSGTASDAAPRTFTWLTTTGAATHIPSRILTVTGITAATKAYDGTTTATLNTSGAALVGVISGDTVTLNTAGATGTFDTKYPGTGKTVTVAGLTIGGADAGNYTLTQPTTTADIYGGTFTPVTPARLLDSRTGNGMPGGTPATLAANTPLTFQVTGRGGPSNVPTGAIAVTGNLTVTDQTSGWALYLGPIATASPTSSTINFVPGEVRANGVTVELGAGGTLSATYISTSGRTTNLVFDVTGYFTQNTSGSTFTPVTPARLLDSRTGNGMPGGTPATLAANTPLTFQVTGRGGPSNVPTGAIAVTGNLTVTDQTSGWALYLGPIATASPTSSTINFVPGEVRANGVTVKLGAGGTLSATYISTSGQTTGLVFDVTGYFTQDLTGAIYVPLTPARLLDSRTGNGMPGGTPATLAANTPLTFQITGRGGPSNVPTGAIAVSGNLTVTDQTSGWAVFLGPNPTPAPGSSTINFIKGKIIANGLTVALSGTGTLSATYISTTSQTTGLVFDVTGYYK